MVAPNRKKDSEQEAARSALLELFDENRDRVFYSKQLEIWHEDNWFHWVTNRALHDLIAEGEVLAEENNLVNAGRLLVVRHKSYRYPIRASSRMVALVDQYSHQDISHDVGDRGETLVQDGFVRNQFVQIGRNTRVYRNKEWIVTDHDLDFIFERDGVAYGVEVKNRLGYMDYNDLKVKIASCEFLGVRPVFAARMLPRTWINEVDNAGGFSLIMKWQMYPRGRQELVNRIRGELGLPVDTPRALQDGTMQRFLNWHAKNV